MYSYNRVRRSIRGNALILSVLILLALTSVGLVSVQRTNTDLLVAANLVRAKQAHFAGESGTARSLVMTGANLNGILFDMHTRNRGDVGDVAFVDRSLRLCQFSTAIPDPTGTGQNNYIPTVAPPAAVESSVARIRQDMAFLVDIVHVSESKGMLGFSVDEDICFQTFDFGATGAIPTADEQTVLETINNADSLVVRNRARAMVGPWECSMKHGS
ncbi:MAG: pilus assembly PilX N-terminal domain-containing protein [Deltaproteobacteria bacterium]|nr:pilus assembly PilX N-terminal domain-containing protein [Deltaproteobacteria bacterium]